MEEKRLGLDGRSLETASVRQLQEVALRIKSDGCRSTIRNAGKLDTSITLKGSDWNPTTSLCLFSSSLLPGARPKIQVTVSHFNEVHLSCKCRLFLFIPQSFLYSSSEVWTLEVYSKQ